MSERTISLALIVKDEAELLERCIQSFHGAYDELIICDTGSKDNTVAIAEKLGAKVIHFNWCEDFAAARQAAFDHCTSDWIMWCDADDVLAAGHAEKIRHIARVTTVDINRFRWEVRGYSIFRERLVKKGSGRWTRPIHEAYRGYPGTTEMIWTEIRIINSPLPGKEVSHDRNRRLLEENLCDAATDFFHLAGELHVKKDRARMMKMANVARAIGIGPVEEYELFMMMAIDSDNSLDRERHALGAYRLIPQRREALVLLCQQAMKDGKNSEALSFARSFISLPKPNEMIWTLQTHWYGWAGAELFCRVLRRNGLYEDAAQVEWKMRRNENPTISLCHATRGRPEKMVECRDLWMQRAKNPANIQHIFAVDSDDTKAISVAKDYAHIIVPAGGGCVAAWNAAARASSGKVLIQLSDDWIPPSGWDETILQRFGDRINGESVLAVSDGIDRGQGQMTQCLCMGIMTRAWFDYQGHMLYPGYKSVFSDNELTDRVYEAGSVIEARDLIFEHTHPITGKVALDQTYSDQNAPERYKDGEKVYLSRKGTFDPKWVIRRQYAAFILATKDDFCLWEVCSRLIEEGVKAFYFGVPTEYWNGRPNSKENMDEVKHVASNVKDRGFESTLMILDVAKYRAPGRHILETEAMVRNEMLNQMRRDGWGHVVVVDGDELWLPGTLQMIDRYIEDNHPKALNIRMIPVAGLPGYPIEGANDVAMCYLAPNGKFSKCRSSDDPLQLIYPRRQVIHFTATRKTKDEIIQKHRESGHYGDPQYPFEEWFVRTLPNIKPGFKRCHMFTEWDAWPLCRNWKQEEWKAMPESIKPYLGEPK